MTEAYYTGFGMIIVLKNVSFVWVCACVWFAVDRPDAKNIEKRWQLGKSWPAKYIPEQSIRKQRLKKQGISTATTQIIQMNSGDRTAIKPLTWDLLLQYVEIKVYFYCLTQDRSWWGYLEEMVE